MVRTARAVNFAHSRQQRCRRAARVARARATPIRIASCLHHGASARRPLLRGSARHAALRAGGLFKIERRVMSEAMDVMLKIGISERRIRDPHCTQAAQQCRLWPCPRTAQRTEAYGPSVSLQWQAVGSTRSSSRTGNAFLPLQSATHLHPCDACGHARAVPGRALGKEG